MKIILIISFENKIHKYKLLSQNITFILNIQEQYYYFLFSYQILCI